MGWGSNSRYTETAKNILTDCTSAEIEKTCHLAKDYIDAHNLPISLVTVNSWNEWTEISDIQPDN